MLAPVRITVPVLVVGLLMVKAPLAPLNMPDKVSVKALGALMVAAPLMVIGLLNVRVDTLDSNIALAPMVIGAEAVPIADAWLTFNVPLFRAMLVLTVLAKLKSNTPFVPAKVRVDTLMALVCVRVAVLVMLRPLPLKPSALPTVPMARLDVVARVKLPVPISAANSEIAFEALLMV